MIRDKLHKKHKKLTPDTLILRQNVTFVKPLEQTLGQVTPINPTLDDAITLNPARTTRDHRREIMETPRKTHYNPDYTIEP